MISVEGLVMPNKPLTNLEILDAAGSAMMDTPGKN